MNASRPTASLPAFAASLRARLQASREGFDIETYGDDMQSPRSEALTAFASALQVRRRSPQALAAPEFVS